MAKPTDAASKKPRAPKRPQANVPSEATEGMERLHKRIAASGICSRRKAEELIREGRVTVNSEVVTEMGVKVSEDDFVEVDGEPIGRARVYTLVMNKPAGYVTTLRDPQGRPTVQKLLPELGAQVKPVGRLDMDSEGLLLFTNDGELAHRLTHPRYGVEKEYQVAVEGEPDEGDLRALREGVWISEGGKTAPAKVVKTFHDKKKNQSILHITIHEGRKRQVRLMCEAIGHPVQTLKRVRIGDLFLKNMPSGSCRMLGQKEISSLRSQVGLH